MVTKFDLILLLIHRVPVKQMTNKRRSCYGKTFKFVQEIYKMEQVTLPKFIETIEPNNE